MYFITMFLLLCIMSPKQFSVISTSDGFINAQWSSKSQSDDYYMLEALSLAKLAQGRTRPNPIVGCVIVAPDHNGTEKIVGKGFHKRSGESHAEVLALAEAGSLANGSTAYVSLEPCNHYGRTPPCTLALLRHGVKRVVAGMVDPDPRVSGSGLKMLRAHGVRAAVIGNSSVGDLCRAANAAFIFRVTRRRPYSIVLLYHNSSQICNLLQEESALEAGSRLCRAAPEIDTVIASCEQWRALTRRLAETEFARPEPESESQYCAPAFPPTHCTVVVVFPSGCDFQDWAEVLLSVRDDPHSRRFVFVCRSFASAVVDSIRQLEPLVQDRILIVQLRNLPRAHTHTQAPPATEKSECNDEVDFDIVGMLSISGDIHAIHRVNESSGNSSTDSFNSSRIFSNMTILEYLSDQIGSNAVLYAVNTSEELGRCLKIDAAQKLVVAAGSEDGSSTGDKPPAFLLNLLKHHSKSDQPTPELVRAREDDSEGNSSSDGSRTVARKHSPLRLWTYNFWSP